MTSILRLRVLRPAFLRHGLLCLVFLLGSLPWGGALAAPGDAAVPASGSKDKVRVGPVSEVAPEDDGEVLWLELSGPVTPAMADVWVDAIARAEEQNANVLIVQMDTPGGMMESMRQIIKSMLASGVPVVVYVAPDGSRAASAGVFLLYAAHVAAMSPGTNMGAAHPVMMGEDKPDETMMGKVTNDAAAYIRSLAELRGRNAEWGEKAVRESVSLTADEALRQNVIDLVVKNRKELLEALDGRVLKTPEGPVTLHTRDREVHVLEISAGKRLLTALADPNVAYILMMLGTYGLIYELANPGAILPGVVGAICLILALYAFSSLPVSYAGVALILLGVALCVAEVMVTSFGLLAAGGVVSLLLGSMMLVKTDIEFARVSLEVLIPVTLVAIGFAVLTATLAVRSLRRRPVSGAEGMVGVVVRLTAPLEPEGRLEMAGESWRARARMPVAVGQQVRVTGFDGLTALVEVVEPDAPEALATSDHIYEGDK
ncbi:MAG: nodulation protein NfeD [Nitrospirota bacterium]|nr:nodulation protein NfeD [Nitrospirota bacterium]